MGFRDLPHQAPFAAEAANEYARRALSASEIAAGRVRNDLDIPYGNDYWQKVDVYLPEDRSLANLPVILFIHGGGWTHGYKEWMGFMAPAIVGYPAIFVSVSYRLAPDNKFPTPLEDCFCALKWVFDNIFHYGGDPKRIYVGGHSAGAHLASLVTLRHDLAERFGLQPSVVRGCFPVSGVYTFEFETRAPGSSEQRFYDSLLSGPDQARGASPVNFTANNRTPFLLTYGTKDLEIVIRTSRLMQTALEKGPAPCRFMIREGLDHFQTNLQAADPNDAWINAVKLHIQQDTSG